ncbi:DUF3105 domain-containing protein [Nocardioides sp. GY 10113]|uniref:DUF3105 domain-containing protein n=1 Tax=Nocardioides sp. GY 10113 TaxID=2569761 RepID=UPI001F0F7F30|nr:DUF3105 domain-containing protein [Nocardioides sp. GY 10113]
MAKASKTAKSDRQKVIDDIRRSQRNAEKRQGRIIVVVCVAIALLIIGAAAFSPVKGWIERQQYKGKTLGEIGAGAEVCSPVVTRDAEGNQDHVDEGVPVDYEFAPPAFGAHWNVGGGVAPVSIATRFYTASTRPPLEALVHNLEHGFTVLWYDETVAEDSSMLAAVKSIAATLDVNDTNSRYSFIAVPWTAEDEKETGAFPDDQHVAFTHWTAKGGKSGDQQEGVWQYCSEPSGAALDTFMKDYPYTDAPEPVGGGQMG